ncbi:hypothetical protein [Streptococcus salivarius]|uniref:hypothetical protein n=1 Tax=Streptococcus salivarius TaxID=1304 RepID=UPI00055C3C09|nr:hypothetical protein [Streptococcus salivarius]MBZ5836879.1 hypothetical protein [Streptococcus salivarius]
MVLKELEQIKEMRKMSILPFVPHSFFMFKIDQKIAKYSIRTLTKRTFSAIIGKKVSNKN